MTGTLGENLASMLAGLAIPAVVFLAGWLAPPSAEGAGANGPESPDRGAQRQEMKRRKRRIIYNNDGNDIRPRKQARYEDPVPDWRRDLRESLCGAAPAKQPCDRSRDPSRRAIGG